MFLNEADAFGTRYRQILGNYTSNLHEKICGEVGLIEIELHEGCSPFNSLHNSEQIFLKISTDEYCSTIFTSSHRIHNVNIAFQFQCKQFCSIQKS